MKKCWCSRPELNWDQRFRKPLLYPFELREQQIFISITAPAFLPRQQRGKVKSSGPARTRRLHKLARIQNAVWVERGFDHAVKLAGIFRNRLRPPAFLGQTD